jgi:hypothetical protein
MSTLVRYPFTRAASAFFELPIETARRILPERIEPVEMRHGTAVLSVSAFDFDLPGGPAFQQMQISIVVAPFAQAGGVYPRTALFPFAVAISHPQMRVEAAERFHVKMWDAEIKIEFEEQERSLSVKMAADGNPVVDLTIYDYVWEHVFDVYQCYIEAPDGRYVAQFSVEGATSDHEEGRGSLRLHTHSFNEALAGTEIDSVPFREVWIRNGMQSFEPLTRISKGSDS